VTKLEKRLREIVAKALQRRSGIAIYGEMLVAKAAYRAGQRDERARCVAAIKARELKLAMFGGYDDNRLTGDEFIKAITATKRTGRAERIKKGRR